MPTKNNPAKATAATKQPRVAAIVTKDDDMKEDFKKEDDEEMEDVDDSEEEDIEFIIDGNENKKNKERDNENEDEENAKLSIDISLPEPPSKKHLRKLKKLQKAGIDTDALTKANVNLLKSSSGGGGSNEDGKRSPYGVWIGNLSYGTTRENILEFLVKGVASSNTTSSSSNTTMGNEDIAGVKDEKEKEGEGEDESTTGITKKEILRLKLPKNTHGTGNRGFAYVDFSNAGCIQYALLLSERLLFGRKVLIKASNDFQGRPATATNASSNGNGVNGSGGGTDTKGPSKTLFIGNLRFETTQDDLLTHFSPAGAIKKVRMATFEDSGKSKGYAWVDFDKVEGSAAVIENRSSERMDVDGDGDGGGDSDGDGGDGDGGVEDKKKVKRSGKRRGSGGGGYMVMAGRRLRIEYAEDPTTRYKKRFGKKDTTDIETNEKEDEQEGEGGGEKFKNGWIKAKLKAAKGGNSKTPFSRDGRRDGTTREGRRDGRRDSTTREGRRDGKRPDKYERRERKHDARLIRPGAALAKKIAERPRIGIVEGTGRKINFDS